MEPIEDILGRSEEFLGKIFSSLQGDGIDVADYELDHICYRVETQERYEELRDVLYSCGEMLIESEINGRMISTFKLDEPIEYQGREIYCVELPSPKRGSPYPEGYEHVEFVIDREFDEFMNLYPEVEFETKALCKKSNPDVSAKYNGFCVKFHQNSLEKVIEFEKSELRK